MAEKFDAVVVGGGVIGLATAWRLSQAGRTVAVLDRSEPGREASWAGGGILDPVTPHKYPAALAALCARSVALFPEFVAELEDEAGFSVELRSTGLMRLSYEGAEELAEERSFLAERGEDCAELDGEGARALEPNLSAELRYVLHQPGILQVRNPRLLKALLRACHRRGVTIAPGLACDSLERSGDRITGVRTAEGHIAADETIIAAGAWSGGLLKTALGLDLPVTPIHGEMLLVETPLDLLGSTLICGEQYMIPRADGHLLIGSTTEERGFRKRVHLGNVQMLLAAAIRMVPRLTSCAWSGSWSGLRPATPDRLPYLGRAAGLSGLILATGHFRNGLLLAPASAEAVGALISGEAPPLDIAPYSPDRPNSTLS